LVKSGASLERIAEALDVDRSTARRRLHREGLETDRMRAARLGRAGRANGEATLVRTCARHGLAGLLVQ
jgi:transposase-like protein